MEYLLIKLLKKINDILVIFIIFTYQSNMGTHMPLPQIPKYTIGFVPYILFVHIMHFVPIHISFLLNSSSIQHQTSPKEMGSHQFSQKFLKFMYIFNCLWKSVL